jgi:hypothetical protein
MKIVSEIASPRLNYVLDYVFNQRFGISYWLIDPTDFSEITSAEPILSYSLHHNQTFLKILPKGLLQENFFHHGKPELTYIEKLPVLFADEKEGGLGFDIFSAIFWMLARYEEYQPFEPDEHARFPASASILFKNNLLETPLVDRWILFLKKKIKDQFPELQFKEEMYRFQPTIDIDSPWCYTKKGILRNVGGLCRDTLKRKWNLVGERLKVLSGLKDDPFFTFDIIEKIHDEKGLNPLFFILVGSYGKFDKTISLTNKTFREFIQSLSKRHCLYLHPSYQASENQGRLEQEIKALELLTGQKIEKLRQHYLRIILPSYYQMIDELGINHDYSFGYADQPGFRAGTCHPFLFYNLITEQTTKLFLHPLTIMDVSLQGYLKLTPAEALIKIDHLIEEVKLVNGTLISLWHNESFDETHEWKGWNEVYIQLIKKATE